MNKQPDESTITLWIDGKLEGEELRLVEAWAQEHPELIAERDAIRAMNADIRDTIPSSVEPPYADFFNQRILRHIEDDQHASVSGSSTGGRRGFWQWLAVPTAAAAMLLCFYMGTRVSETNINPAPSVVAVSTVSTVYTPDGDVSADMFRADDADATVIVLTGLEDIPDDVEMVGGPAKVKESDAMMVSTAVFY